jgi:MFS family permease
MCPLTRNEKNINFGFRNNGNQLFFHCILSVLIGVTLKLTTFKDALLAAASTGRSHTQQTAFLISFGFTKAFSNLAVGRISDLYGRKIPHCFGWIAGIFLGSFLLAVAATTTDTTTTTSSHHSENDNSWTWYVVANIFLGAQQGWTWTTNIFMFIDILGPDNRALASGISNSVGYLSSAITTYIAAALSVQESFFIVLGSSVLGLAISVFGMKDTSDFVLLEASSMNLSPTVDEDQEGQDGDDHRNIKMSEEEWDGIQYPKAPGSSIVSPGGEYELVALSSVSSTTTSRAQRQPAAIPSSFGAVLRQTCWYNKSTAILLVAGLMTNLITSLAWGLVLIWARRQTLSKFQVANIGSAFTFSKAGMMILASRISDKRQIRKPILIGGFLTAIVGLIITALADTNLAETRQIYHFLLIGGIAIGIGIGSVYCVMSGAISDHTPALDRACAIGIYKLWRDSGYAVGGLLTGILADVFNGSFVITTLVVAGMVAVLVLCIIKFYHDSERCLGGTPRTTRRIHPQQLQQ